MTDWTPIRRELDCWQADGRRATLWLRDDDACRDSPALARLLAIAGDHAVPVAVAAIPALSEASLVEALTGCAFATIVQHGYAHLNHAPAGARNWELGAHRPAAAVLAELVAGRQRLTADFGPRFVPVLVPPWNRIAPELSAALPGAGFRGLSTFGPRGSSSPAPGLLQCNTHVDLIAWRKGRGFIGANAALERLAGHLRARRDGSADATEPTGVLTHHLDLDDEAWRFLAHLAERTRGHPAVDWIDAAAAFYPAPGRAEVISGRSA